MLINQLFLVIPAWVTNLVVYLQSEVVVVRVFEDISRRLVTCRQRLDVIRREYTVGCTETVVSRKCSSCTHSLSCFRIRLAKYDID